MKQLILILCLFATITACKDKANQEETNTEAEVQKDTATTETAKNELQLGCYKYLADGTELRMEVIEKAGQSVRGKLWYTHAEKDKNTGTFNGTLNGDKLIGQYTFMSEGVESVRDVAFKIEKDQIVEGFADLNEAGTKFRDTTSIIYSATTPWKKAHCD